MILNSDLHLDNQPECSLRSSQALQASAFVGRRVMIPGNSIKVEAENISSVSIKIPEQAYKIIVLVASESGELIKKTVLGHLRVGFFEFKWNGLSHTSVRVPSGRYFLTANCTQQGKEVSLLTFIEANVNSVSLGENGEGVRLIIAGIGEVGLEQIICFS